MGRLSESATGCRVKAQTTQRQTDRKWPAFKFFENERSRYFAGGSSGTRLRRKTVYLVEMVERYVSR